MGHSSASFSFIFVFSIQLTVNNVQYKRLPMTGFKPQTSGIGSNSFTNWATNTALIEIIVCIIIFDQSNFPKSDWPNLLIRHHLWYHSKYCKHTYLPTYLPNDDKFDQISCLLKEREIEREGRRMDELDGDEDEAGRGSGSWSVAGSKN